MKIYPDKIEITNINTQQTISKTSTTKFSSNRLLVAEFNVAEMLIRDILKEMGLSRRTLKVLIQQMEAFDDGLSEVEKRVLRDLAEQAGGAIVYIVNRIKMMSAVEIKDFLNLKSSNFQVQDNGQSMYPFIGN